MSTNHESSFGARLKNVTDLVSYIKGFSNYNPPRTEETAAELETLALAAEQLNGEAARLKSTYRTEVNKRQQLFSGGMASLEKLLSPITKAVAAHYGKNSDESIQVASLVRKGRTPGLLKPPAAEGENGDTAEKNSISQRSYGSLAQHFKDLVNTLGKLNGYAPSNAAISQENLTSLSGNINSSNTAVAVAFQQLSDTRNKRREVYADMAERVSRIKSYVSAQYGNTSDEYRLIRKLKA